MSGTVDRHAPVYIAGHTGMVGSAILRRFKAAGYDRIVTRTHAQLDLRDHRAVREFFDANEIDSLVIAAAKVGGIGANMNGNAEFLLENLRIQNNLIEEAYLHHVRKVCFLGSSCIYPRDAENPIRESALLSGPLEPTNEGYALAKIAGYKLCGFLAREHGLSVVSLMPCNLYGPNDRFHPQNSHVLAAMIRRFCDAADRRAECVVCWGTGTPEREFLHTDDLARAVLLAMETYGDPDFLNVGTGRAVTIAELAFLAAKLAGYQGEIRWDASKPDGMKRKIMDISRISALGWKPEIELADGMAALIAEYRRRCDAHEFDAFGEF